MKKSKGKLKTTDETRTKAFVARPHAADAAGSQCLYTLVHDVREVPFQADGNEVLLMVEYLKATVCKINGAQGPDRGSQVCGSRKEILHVDVSQIDNAQECSKAKAFKEAMQGAGFDEASWMAAYPKKEVVQHLAKAACAISV